MNYTLSNTTIPVNQLEKAVNIAVNVRKKALEIHNAKKALGTFADVWRKKGEDGVNEYRAKCQAYDEELKAIIDKANGDIKTLREDAIKSIVDSTLPHGDDITGENSADFALLKNDLISTPEQLEALISKHDNNAFKLAANHYAKAHDWDNFTFVDASKPINDYTSEIFKSLDIACSEPYGAIAMQYTATAGEYQRLARAYEIETDFLNAGGSAIESHVDTSLDTIPTMI